MTDPKKEIAIYFKIVIKESLPMGRRDTVFRKNPTVREQLFEIKEKVYCLEVLPVSHSNSGEILKNYLRLLKRKYKVIHFEVLEAYDPIEKRIETL